MLEKWRIPKELFDLDPITRMTCTNFYGRESEIKKLEKFLVDSNIVLIEGEAGVGKTSLGNYVRFNLRNILTPASEIKCQPNWSNFHFLIELQSHILGEIYRDDSVFQSLQHAEIVKAIYNRNKTQEFRSIGASVAGLGGSFGTTISQQSVTSEGSLFEELDKLVQLLRNHTGLQNPIVIQINNLDLNAVFSETDLARFLNCIRDTLQIKGINFIIIGTQGLVGLIRSKVERLQQIISTTIQIEAFEFEDLINVFNRRIQNSQYHDSKIPLEEDLIRLIYNHSNGATREIMNEIRELLFAFQDEPLLNIITIHEASLYYAKELGRNLEKNIFSNKNLYNILFAIKSSPGISQKQIIDLVKVKQGTVSGLIKKLVDNNIVMVTFSSGVSAYRLRTKYELALNILRNTSLSSR